MRITRCAARFRHCCMARRYDRRRASTQKPFAAKTKKRKLEASKALCRGSFSGWLMALLKKTPFVNIDFEIDPALICFLRQHLYCRQGARFIRAVQLLCCEFIAQITLFRAWICAHIIIRRLNVLTITNWNSDSITWATDSATKQDAMCFVIF